jgi:hypothetical protein
MKKNVFFPWIFASLTMLNISVAFSAWEVPGKMFYKMPDEQLVFRDMTMVKEEQNDHKIVLRGKNSEIVSDHIHSKEVHGRKVLTIVFKNVPHAKNKIMILTGTYLRGTNGGLYYGDIYVKAKGSDDDLSLKSLATLDFTGHHPGPDDVRFVGGFKFKKML